MATMTAAAVSIPATSGSPLFAGKSSARTMRNGGDSGQALRVDEVEEEEEETSECSEEIAELGTGGTASPSLNHSSSSQHRSSTSPRFEAFVMTGDKILRLNSKISPNYAKAKQSELPQHTEILESPTHHGQSPAALEHRVMSKYQYTRMYRQRLEDERRQLQQLTSAAMPNSRSEHLLVATGGPQHLSTTGGVSSLDEDDEQSKASSMTVNAMCPATRGGASSSTSGDQRQQNSLGDVNGEGGLSAELPSPAASHSEPVSPARFGGFGKRKLDGVFVDGDFSMLEQPAQQVKQRSLSDNEEELEHRWRAESHHRTAPTALSDNEATTAALRSRLQAAAMLEIPEFGRGISQKEPDQEAASRLAKRLYFLEGFRRSDVAPHLSKNNEFGALVSREYLRQFNFAGLRLDAALRLFLSHFALVGETADRERIIVSFSRRYHECNPGVLPSEDAVHTLACALLLLNSDLHAPNVGKRMTCREFVENVSQNGAGAPGHKYARDLLKTLYQSIRTNPLEWANDRSDSESADSGLPGQSQYFDNRLLEIPDPEQQVEYKKGWVMRKCLLEPDGVRTPVGRRGWRMFYATLKGMILYLHRDEQGFRRGAASYQTFRNATRVHHALATRASDYKKKPHVFRVQTATLGEYLFETSDPQEMQSWIDAINFVAACFSAPPLPAAVSSRKRFHRPLLPGSHSKLSMREQLREHEKRLADIDAELDEHRSLHPVITSKPRVLQEYAEVEIYLQSESQRYRTYVHLLRSKMDEFLSGDDADDDEGGAVPMTTSAVSSAAGGTPVLAKGRTRAAPTAMAVSEPGLIAVTVSGSSSGSSNGDRCSYKLAIYDSGPPGSDESRRANNTPTKRLETDF